MQKTLTLHKTGYWLCAAGYVFFMFMQYTMWFQNKSMGFFLFLATMPPLIGQLYCIFKLRFDTPSIYFPVSIFSWFMGFLIATINDSGPAYFTIMAAGSALLGMLWIYRKAMLSQGYTMWQAFLVKPGNKPAHSPATPQVQEYEKTKPARRSIYKDRNFSSLFGMEEEKKRILQASKEILNATSGEPRNGILLTGAPGNGKTELAKSLAGELALPYVELTIGDLASRWTNVGIETLMSILREARAAAPCVLMIDEIDSILIDRGAVLQAESEAPRLVNAFLTEIVNLRTSKVIVVAATNHPDKLDRASVREGRFDYKIEICPPNLEARARIVEAYLKKNLPAGVFVDREQIETATRRWNGFSTARLIGVCKEVIAHLRDTGGNSVSTEDLFQALRTLNGTAGKSVEHACGLENMLLPSVVRQRLLSIAQRMLNVHEIEQAGGSLPTGIVFYGEHPGTGKTESARSLAKDTGWAFLDTTSFELIADAKKIDSLYQKALDIRPCIIFIDEANDILRHRGQSAHSAIANKLLTIMDGASSQRSDVMFVVATNFVEEIDKAFLRGGRIAEKFHMTPLDADQAINYVNMLIANSPANFHELVTGDLFLWAMEKSDLVHTVANLREVFQNAINLKISRTGNLGEVIPDDVTAATRSMRI